MKLKAEFTPKWEEEEEDRGVNHNMLSSFQSKILKDGRWSVYRNNVLKMIMTSLS